jgi:uncharacterized protein
VTARRMTAALFFAFVLISSSPAAAQDVLVQAAARGDLTAVRQLLRDGADVHAADTDGATALHRVVRADDLEFADQLIRAGASATRPTIHGITPLYLAAANGNAAMARHLLDAGAAAGPLTRPETRC